jgi:hypothetical protein
MVGDCALLYLQPSRIITLRQSLGYLEHGGTLSYGEWAYIPKLLGRPKLYASGTGGDLHTWATLHFFLLSLNSRG